MESKLYVSDNTGIRIIKCIQVIRKPIGLSGNMVMASVQSVRPRRKIKKGDITRALIVRTVRNQSRLVGCFIRANSNSVVLLKNKELLPYGNRMKTVAFLELRKYGFAKLLTMTKYVV
jgi:large subunit ribosomal protein L14